MRLALADGGEGVRARLMQGLMRRRLGAVPDIVVVCQHRPGFFGRPFLAWAQRALRGRSPWRRRERELMAALVSDRNRCRFCTAVHSEVTGRLGTGEVARVLADPASAGLSPALTATLALIEKLTLDPSAFAAQDVAVAAAAGVRAQALLDAVEVCAVFNTINRVADALDFEVPAGDALGAAARALVLVGYRA